MTMTRIANILRRATATAIAALTASVAAFPAMAQAPARDGAAVADLETGCRKKDGDSCLALGVRLLEGAPSVETRARAVEILLQGCEHMSGAACGKAAANLAAPGATPDWPRVAKLFDRGCGLQDPWSCQTGAMIYYVGSGVTKDWVRARSMFTAGCGGPGDLVAKACRYAGTMYVAGQGGDKSEDIAKLMFKRACDKRDAASCKVLNLPTPE